DRCGRQRGALCVPMVVIQPVEVLAALQGPCRLPREEWGQVQDGNVHRAEGTFQPVEIVARTWAERLRINQERPVNLILPRDQDNKQIEARFAQVLSEPPPVTEGQVTPAVEVVYPRG